MSKKHGKYTRQKKSGSRWLVIVLAVVLLLLAAMLVMLFLDQQEGPPAQETQGATLPQDTQTEQPGQETQQTQPQVSRGNLPLLLDNGLEITAISSYTGIFMEDGSDELLSNILMMKVVNRGERTVEYAELTIGLGEETAEFTLSTLKPGGTIVLLEKNRMAYSTDVDYAAAEVSCKAAAFFEEPLDLHGDELEIQILDGAINVTNISGADIGGDIAIYYKNASGGVYYGGITYRITLSGGLKADEVRQLMASHFSASGSEILFVTIVE